MIQYKEILDSIKRTFPEAKEVKVSILTASGDSIHFGVDITKYGEKDGLIIVEKKETYPFLSDEDIRSLTFDEAMEKYGHILSVPEIIAIQSDI